MGKLFRTIQQLVADGNFAIGQHASERLEERGIMEWQAVAGLENSDLIKDAAQTRARIPRSKSANHCLMVSTSKRYGHCCGRLGCEAGNGAFL